MVAIETSRSFSETSIPPTQSELSQGFSADRPQCKHHQMSSFLWPQAPLERELLASIFFSIQLLIVSIPGAFFFFSIPMFSGLASRVEAEKALQGKRLIHKLRKAPSLASPARSLAHSFRCLKRFLLVFCIYIPTSLAISYFPDLAMLAGKRLKICYSYFTLSSTADVWCHFS